MEAKNNVKDFLKKFTIFNYIYLIIAYAIIIVGFAIGDEKSIFSLITSLMGVTAFMLSAKGLVVAPIVCSVYYVMYSILSINQKFYGEAIVNGLIALPIMIFTIISWFRNKHKQDTTNVQVNNISKKEYLALIPAIMVVFAGFYFLLRALNTEQLIISTFSTVCSTVATYLLMRRSPYYSLGYIIADVLVVSLWTINISTYGLTYLPTLLSVCCFFVNDVYGFISWQKRKKEQNQIDKNEKINQDA